MPSEERGAGCGLQIARTIIRPIVFMDILVGPGLGLDQGRFDLSSHRISRCSLSLPLTSEGSSFRSAARKRD